MDQESFASQDYMIHTDFITSQNPDRQIRVTDRDGELSEGRNALLPTDFEREFTSRDALKTDIKIPRLKAQGFLSGPARCYVRRR